ncbi:MAG: hypothetical protein QOF03_870 [Alphaproteobacteria bacterium]|jgi:hypothetical protein|nr:hypothetical protein [Alphaproteobacteria bacterium]
MAIRRQLTKPNGLLLQENNSLSHLRHICHWRVPMFDCGTLLFAKVRN